MVEARIATQIEYRSGGARFRIRAAVYQARDARVQRGADAHDARLDGHVEDGLRQPVVARRACRRAQRSDLGVSRRVGVDDTGVPGPAEQHAVPHHDGANGHLPPRPGGAGLAEGLLHPPAIGGGGGIAPGGGAAPSPGVESRRYFFSSFFPMSPVFSPPPALPSLPA